MSWQPSNDPVLGDPMSCDALDLVIVPRTRDLGDGFAVRRALPHGKRQMVGPFIFFDHFGPVQFVSGKGMDVRPHPHIGLATVTYLFDGAIMHRDSEGNVQEIAPGAMNLMTAGRGIAHSERTPDAQRASGQKMLGLQSWIALPVGSEEIAPSFQHYAAGDLPMITERDFTARVIAGSSFGIASPVSMVSPWFYTEVTAVAGRANHALARKLGADAVIDYSAGPISGQWDVILDVVGTLPYPRAKGLLAEAGRLLPVTATLAEQIGAALRPRRGTHRISGGVIGEGRAAMERLIRLHRDGVYRPHLGRTLPFAEVRAAHALAGSRHKQGNVVIVMP